jgi:hypothetical protein
MEKRKLSIDYNDFYVKSRHKGFQANNKHSKFECLLLNKLNENGINAIPTNKTKIDKKSSFSQKYKNNYFFHDIYLPEYNIIIEYNGIY